jgi:hypothetical protein
MDKDQLPSNCGLYKLNRVNITKPTSFKIHFNFWVVSDVQVFELKYCMHFTPTLVYYVIEPFLRNLTVAKLVKKFLVFYGTPGFISLFTLFELN